MSVFDITLLCAFMRNIKEKLTQIKSICFITAYLSTSGNLSICQYLATTKAVMLNMLKELVGKLSDCGVGRNGVWGWKRVFEKKRKDVS